MDWRIFATVFATVFIAELGDKTQLATLLFAADKEVSKWLVFVAASLALIATSALGVLAGSAISQYVNERVLHTVAGIGFIVIGVWTLWK
jgi:putative Ca2+/H+ antiporter (TMEM165/GDT1 family)